MRKRYIFGYGSLVSPEDVARTLGRRPNMVYPVTLNGWIREWSVVIDNTIARHRCIRKADGSLLPGYIAVLNVRRPGPGEHPTNPNGVLFEVTEADLRRIDTRETHYRRVDVTRDVVNRPTGIIYTYSGLDRFLLGSKHAQTAIPGHYHALVRQGFTALGPNMYETYLSTTLPTRLRIHLE